MTWKNYPDGVNENIDDPQPQNWLQSNFKLVAISAAVIVAIVSVFGFLNWQRSINAAGYEWQNNALAKYQGIQTTLSTCLDNTRMGAQVAERERQTIIDGMKAIVAARTANHQEAIPGDATVFVNAVAEAYPQISSDLYKQLLTVAVGCRNEVNGAQKDMQSYAARFKTWTKEGNVLEGNIREQFPNAELVVQGPNGPLTGKAALESMATPIITKEAGDATTNKTMPTENPFPSASPSPSASPTATKKK